MWYLVLVAPMLVRGALYLGRAVGSHHADFKRISPTSARDCDRLVASRLKGYWDD